MVRVYVVPYDTRYGVISAASPRVTPGNTFYGQPQAESRAVETYGIDGILRAGRDIPATGRFKRRNAGPVKINREKEKGGEKILDEP